MIEFNISHLNEYRISECIDEICTNFIRSCSVFCNYNCVPSTEKIIPCFRSNFQCDTPTCMWYYIEPVYLIIISIIIFGGVCCTIYLCYKSIQEDGLNKIIVQ